MRSAFARACALLALSVHLATPAAPLSMAPVQPPATLDFENRGGALDLLALPGMFARRGIEYSRAVELANLMREHDVKLGEELTQALLAALQEQGVDVALLDDVPRFTDDPTAIDYAKFAAPHELVLSGNFDAVGFYSGRFTTQFRPRVNVTVNLVRCKDEKYIYSQSVYYGADARKPAEDQIPADPKYVFESYQDVMARPDDVVASLREGVQRIARQVAAQVAHAPH